MSGWCVGGGVENQSFHEVFRKDALKGVDVILDATKTWGQRSSETFSRRLKPAQTRRQAGLVLRTGDFGAGALSRPSTRLNPTFNPRGAPVVIPKKPGSPAFVYRATASFQPQAPKLLGRGIVFFHQSEHLFNQLFHDGGIVQRVVLQRIDFDIEQQ